MLTGKTIVHISVALAMGAATWVFSPIKFEADTGLLLSVIFVGNMAGALLPSLAHFLPRSRRMVVDALHLF